MSNSITRFLKVSFNEFKKYHNCENTFELYEQIKLPKRATKFSAGYDFYMPFDVEIKSGETIQIPTGIRCQMRHDYMLMIIPKSGLGFKYRLQLDNTIGIIDADYFESINEGHILVKLTNDSRNENDLILKKGDPFIQAVFVKYELIDNDCVDNKRKGGLGSTSSNNDHKINLDDNN